MRTYLQLLRTDGVWRLLAGAMPARLAYGMLPLALFFTARDHTHSLSVAGLAIGANTLTSSGGAAVRGKLVDRYGQTRPLLTFVPVYAVLLVLLALFGHDTASVVGLATALGLFAPPINMSTRPLWKDLVRPEDLRTAWAFDSVMSEITSILGPVIATALALSFSASVALLTTAALVLGGGLGLLSSPLSRRWRGEPATPGEPGLLRNKAIQVLCLEGVVMGLSIGMLEVAVPSAATLAHVPGRAALLMAALALGVIVGALRAGAVGSWRVTTVQGLRRSTTAAAVALLALAFSSPRWSMALVLFAVGIAFGPAQVFYLELVDRVRPRGAAVSALGFLWTMEGTASAVGAALAGRLAQAHGATVVEVLVSASAFGSPIVLWLGRHRLGSARPDPAPVLDGAVAAAR